MILLCCLLAIAQIVSISAKPKQKAMYELDGNLADYLADFEAPKTTTSRSYYMPFVPRKHLKVSYSSNNMMQIHPTVRLKAKHTEKPRRRVALENIYDQRENSSKRQKAEWKQLLDNYLDTVFANYVPEEEANEIDKPESNVSNENSISQEQDNETEKVGRKYKNLGKKSNRLNKFWVSRYAGKASDKRRATAEVVYNAILTYFRRVIDIAMKNDNLQDQSK